MYGIWSFITKRAFLLFARDVRNGGGKRYSGARRPPSSLSCTSSFYDSHKKKTIHRLAYCHVLCILHLNSSLELVLLGPHEHDAKHSSVLDRASAGNIIIVPLYVKRCGFPRTSSDLNCQHFPFEAVSTFLTVSTAQ